MDLNTEFEHFKDWSPIRFYRKDQNPYIDWCYMGKTRFTDSFFEVTIQKRLYEPFNMLFRHQTPIEFLGEMYEKQCGLEPNGFIFHLSRCGSTLISQMLAALPQNIVLSEPPPVDAILRKDAHNGQVDDAQKIEWLKWFVSASGQPRGGEKFYFIKFDSWSTLDLSLILEAFPEVPVIFLYRNPLEIIVSHLRQPGVQMIPGAIKQLLPGLDLTEVLQMSREEYCARVLAKICENVLENSKNTNIRLLNYNQLPEAVNSSVLAHFQISYPAADLEKMKSVTQFHAKTPRINFTPDSAEKQCEATETVRRAAAEFVNPHYEKLETLRIQQETVRYKK